MDSNNLIFLIVLTILCFSLNKFFIFFSKKSNSNLLVDDQFSKPQAFHELPVLVTGGIGIFLSIFIVYSYLFLFQNIIYFEYISICTLFFFLGFMDDLKINLRPKLRLILMIILLIFLIKYNNFYIEKTGIKFLNDLLQYSDIFSLIFVVTCFLFIINGANLIDGYNGLLGLHTLIIILNLFIINYLNKNLDIAYFLLCFSFILIIFLKFNFPSAKIFLGDGGSYLLGAFISISVIQTSIANPSISPFYFCILLFYLFFEVFFSFFRKLFVNKISPLIPDKKHLHMLIYKFLYNSNKSKFKSNYYVSIVINFIYLILIIPSILFMEDGLLCKYYSMILISVYLFSYKIIHEKTK